MPENLALQEPCTELNQYGLQGRSSTSQRQCAQLKEWGTSLFCVFDGRLFQSSGRRGFLGVTYPSGDSSSVGCPHLLPLLSLGLSGTAVDWPGPAPALGIWSGYTSQGPLHLSAVELMEVEPLCQS